jgi:hypothetical protein
MRNQPCTGDWHSCWNAQTQVCLVQEANQQEATIAVGPAEACSCGKRPLGCHDCRLAGLQGALCCQVCGRCPLKADKFSCSTVQQQALHWSLLGSRCAYTGKCSWLLVWVPVAGDSYGCLMGGPGMLPEWACSLLLLERSWLVRQQAFA